MWKDESGCDSWAYRAQGVLTNPPWDREGSGTGLIGPSGPCGLQLTREKLFPMLSGEEKMEVGLEGTDLSKRYDSSSRKSLAKSLSLLRKVSNIEEAPKVPIKSGTDSLLESLASTFTQDMVPMIFLQHQCLNDLRETLTLPSKTTLEWILPVSSLLQKPAIFVLQILCLQLGQTAFTQTSFYLLPLVTSHWVNSTSYRYSIILCFRISTTNANSPRYTENLMARMVDGS